MFNVVVIIIFFFFLIRALHPWFALYHRHQYHQCQLPYSNHLKQYGLGKCVHRPCELNEFITVLTSASSSKSLICSKMLWKKMLDKKLVFIPICLSCKIWYEIGPLGFIVAAGVSIFEKKKKKVFFCAHSSSNYCHRTLTLIIGAGDEIEDVLDWLIIYSLPLNRHRHTCFLLLLSKDQPVTCVMPVWNLVNLATLLYDYMTTLARRTFTEYYNFFSSDPSQV